MHAIKYYMEINNNQSIQLLDYIPFWTVKSSNNRAHTKS